MNLQQFIDKYNGQKVDVDGVYQNQCTDLTKLWLREIGYEVSGAWGNATDWDKNGSRPDLQWIANTPTGIPKEGDIMVFGGGSYGHVSVFIDGNATSFRSLDQNYPSGKLEPVGIFTHKYTGSLYVKGWLRPLKYNNTPPPPLVDPKDAIIADLQNRLNACENKPPVQVPYEVDRPETLKELENARASLVGANKAISDIKVELENCLKTKSDLFNELDLIYSDNYIIKRNILTKLAEAIKSWFERKKK